MPSSYIKVLTPPNPDDLFEGAQCLAIYANDGMWYICTIEKVLSDVNESSDISHDLRPMLLKF